MNVMKHVWNYKLNEAFIKIIRGPPPSPSPHPYIPATRSRIADRMASLLGQVR